MGTILIIEYKYILILNKLLDFISLQYLLY